MGALHHVSELLLLLLLPKQQQQHRLPGVAGFAARWAAEEGGKVEVRWLTDSSSVGFFELVMMMVMGEGEG